jgi:hypothetical protein
MKIDFNVSYIVNGIETKKYRYFYFSDMLNESFKLAKYYFMLTKKNVTIRFENQEKIFVLQFGEMFYRNVLMYKFNLFESFCDVFPYQIHTKKPFATYNNGEFMFLVVFDTSGLKIKRHYVLNVHPYLHTTDFLIWSAPDFFFGYQYGRVNFYNTDFEIIKYWREVLNA